MILSLASVDQSKGHFHAILVKFMIAYAFSELIIAVFIKIYSIHMYYFSQQSHW